MRQGYGIQSAPVRVPDGWVVKGLILLVLIGGSCGYPVREQLSYYGLASGG